MKLINQLTSIAFILFFTLTILWSENAYAQAPEGVNYQAIARDNNGNALVNRMVSVRFGILQTSATGTLLYEEQYDMITTNDFGLFNLVIGDGGNTGNGSLSGFDQIDWGSNSHFLKVEVDAGSGFEDLGTTQLLSVPYALYAKDQQVMFYDDVRIDLTNYTVNYRFDRSSLEQSEKEKLQELIQKLKGKAIKIEIISHTDTRGSVEFSRELSQKRTNEVMNYLKQNGLTEASFVANYYGELRPIIDCGRYTCDNDDHRLNRRTEFKFLDPELDPVK